MGCGARFAYAPAGTRFASSARAPWLSISATKEDDVIGCPASRAAAYAAATMLALIVTFGSSLASAQTRDRQPPTTPTNLVVTGVTPYSVSLTWNPSTDNSGRFSYVICCGNTSSMTVPQNTTSVTYTAGLEAGRTFSLRVYAIDAAGNASGVSNSVTGRLPADRTPPSTPSVTVTDIGSTHATLAWRSVEDGPHVWFWVYQNGQPVLQGSSSTSATIPLLEPETTYTFTVQARDFAMNFSPMSAPVLVTTEAVNPNDRTPPSAPTNLRESHYDGEITLRWDQSTDDFDPQSLIRYNVFVNGELASVIVGGGRTVVSGQPGANTITIVAVDTAGNESAAASITVEI